MNALRHGFAGPSWQQSSEPGITLPDLSSVELAYITLMEKRSEIDSERWRLVAQIDKLIASDETHDVVRLLRRAAALDRYNRTIAAAARRLLKQAKASATIGPSILSDAMPVASSESDHTSGKQNPCRVTEIM